MIQNSEAESNRKSSDQIDIKLDAYQNNQKSTLLLSELGVLATAINRAMNDAAIPYIEQKRQGSYQISRASQEPNLVQTSITGVKNGSVILEVLVAATDYVKENDTSIITGLIASMAWDGAKVIGKHLSRAATRLGGSIKSHKTTTNTIKIDPIFNDDISRNIPEEIPAFYRLTDNNKIPESISISKPEPMALRTVEVTISVYEITHCVTIQYDANGNFSSHS